VNYGLDEGQWYCEALVEGYSLTVLTLNGPEEIELCSADEGKETLGVVTAPDGNSKAISKRSKTSSIRGLQGLRYIGSLPASFAWTNYVYRLWMAL
jgi:hypothetical protein